MDIFRLVFWGILIILMGVSLIKSRKNIFKAMEKSKDMMKKMHHGIQILFLFLCGMAIFKGNMVLWLGLFVISLVGALVFGRFYCGYVCPMNTLMSVTEKLTKKLKWQTKKVPDFLQNKTSPWIVLVVMILIMVISKKVLHKEIPILLFLMALSVLVTLKFEQWVFHNHICPYGALLSLTGKYAKYATQVEQDKCVGCKKCEAVCPSKAIAAVKDNGIEVINPALCHQCQLICSQVCPKDAIHYGKK